jgi:hypothetical protein
VTTPLPRPLPLHLLLLVLVLVLLLVLLVLLLLAAHAYGSWRPHVQQYSGAVRTPTWHAHTRFGLCLGSSKSTMNPELRLLTVTVSATPPTAQMWK